MTDRYPTETLKAEAVIGDGSEADQAFARWLDQMYDDYHATTVPDIGQMLVVQILEQLPHYHINRGAVYEDVLYLRRAGWPSFGVWPTGYVNTDEVVGVHPRGASMLLPDAAPAGQELYELLLHELERREG